MPDTNGILRKEDFEVHPGLEGLVSFTMASLLPAMSNFAAQKGIDFKDGNGIYPTLAWSERYTGGQEGGGGEFTVMKTIVVYPTQNSQGLLCVKVIPSALKVSGTVYSHNRPGRFTQASERPLLGSLERAYQYVSSLQPAGITHQEEDALVLA